MITEYARVAAEFPNVATFYDKERHRKRLSKNDFKLHRMAFFGEFLRNEVLPRKPSKVAIEHYSYGSRSNSQYEIGEIGGIAKDGLIAARIQFRLWGPGQVKAFAGISKKEKPIKFCLAQWGNNWVKYNCGLKTPQAAGDCADSNVLAMMALAEYRFKLGIRPPVVAPGHDKMMKVIDGMPWNSEQMLTEDESYG